jgi:hypothetical protein
MLLRTFPTIIGSISISGIDFSPHNPSKNTGSEPLAESVLLIREFKGTGSPEGCRAFNDLSGKIYSIGLNKSQRLVLNFLTNSPMYQSK